ncbi:MAG: nucleotidyltransferase domain-containing protein [Candidatus Micrarchaeota archaeon]|nr:nucleotidyltransferase domain-containing protein [Candidatus Micrarchaeota archaeon]
MASKKDLKEGNETKMGPKMPMSKKLKKFSVETRLKSAQEFKKKVLEKFGDYIKAVILFGSLTRGKGLTGKSDLDIYLIFDDTKASIKDFQKIRSKIDEDIRKIGKEIDPRISPQPIIALTEFMSGLRQAHPLFYNIVREGFAIYDTGFFIPMRKLLEWGHFPATPEAVKSRMESVVDRINRVENVKLIMVAEDLFYVFLEPAQAVLMYLGLPPPPPKLAVSEVRTHLVSNGLLDEKYAKMLEEIIAFRKAVEHKEVKKISGKEVDEWIKKAKEYLEVMKKLLLALEAQRKSMEIKKNYETVVKGMVLALKSRGKLPKDPKELPKVFKKEFVDTGEIPSFYLSLLEKLIKLRKQVEEKKIHDISEREVFITSEYVKRFLSEISRKVPKKE